MGEIKSVKVDNWGVFFLQKLQNFFNKTDYCDLTLQFDDNSQLKVHRLVLSACTDYFNVLEQTYEVTDDILIMPRELQADVVVPIVNFMYTGTLEFEINMYGRLLKTAKDMNMTVLLKLLEAHKRTVEGARVQNTARAPPKNSYNTQKKMTPIRTVRPVERTYSATPSATSSVQHHTSTPQQQRRVQSQPKITQYKNIQIKPVSSGISTPYRKPLPDAAAIVVKYPHSQTTVKGPSRFDCADEILLPPDSFESSFDNISYESKPLITATQIIKEERDMDDYDQLIQQHTSINQSSPFEQLRKSYTSNSNKRPPSTDSSMGSPPEKKPNIQDVKEYAEQQRMRKQITAEYDDDHEYDEVLDDEFHHDDDDEDYVPPASYQKQNQQKVQQPKSIVVKQDADRKSTIVLKNSGPDTDHAKIISEVLKKYPHLVKKPDSVKFQIMTKSGKTTQRLIIKEEPASTQPEVKKPIVISQQPVVKPKPVQQTIPQPSTSKAVPAPAAPVAPTQPKRIDSKTMHALIALGAENTSGPWLCLKCGVNGRPISIPSYRGFRRHLINTHKEKIDPRLCEYCGWRSRDNRELIHHLLVKHSVKPPATYDFPSCEVCSEILLNEETLTQHMELSHPEYKENYNNCMYCNKQFENNTIMYNHVRAKHKEQAQEDGVIEYSDNDDSFDTDAFVAKQLKHEKHPQNTESNEKVKIISDISLKKEIPIIKTSEVVTSNKLRLPESSEAEALNNVANSIATSLGLVDNATAIDGSQILPTEYINTEMENIHTDFDKKVTKILASDGSVMELTDAQREEIISQLDDQHSSEVVMVLNQESFDNVNTESTSSPVTTQTFGNGDDSMFIVYSEPTETEKSKSNELGTKSAVKNVAKDSSAEVKKSNENTISSDIEWQDPTVSEIFDGNADETGKQLETSVEDSLGESDDVNNLNESEDNIERVIREMDQGLTPEKPKSKTGKTEDHKDSVEETDNMKSTDEMKKNKVELLTGDWSDDDEEELECDKQTSSKSKDETSSQPADKKESTEILFEVSVSNPSPKSRDESKVTGDKVKTDGKTVKTEAKEQTDNDVTQEKDKDCNEEEESAEKPATPTSERRISESEDPLLEEDSDSKTTKEESKSEKDECKLEDKNESKTSIEKEANNSSSDKKEVKPEISNLVNDWDDEDDEEI